MRYSPKMLAAGLLIGGAALYAGAACGEDGWITLLDTGKKGDWDEVGKANWEMKEGVLTADKLEGKDLATSSVGTPTRIFRSAPNSGLTTRPTAASSFAASSRRASAARPAMRSTSSTSGLTRPTAPARS